MSSTSEKHLIEIMLFNVEHGDTSTCIKFNIHPETLSRYKRAHREKGKRIAKILLLDIETAPMQVLAWGLFKPYLSHDNILKKGFILSWAAKWLFSSETKSDVLKTEEAKKGNDKRICESIWNMINDADIIIGHNIRKFDIKWLNAEFILNGIKPPSPYQTIDTLTEARKHFKFPSNRLDYLGKIMVRKEKIETNYKLWKMCMIGDQDALQKMVKYNENDVLLLEDVYVELRPWIKSHPNMGMYIDSDKSVCGNCGSENLIWEDKYYTTMVSKFAAYRCNNCGAYSRCRTTALNKEQRENLLASTAR